MPNFTSNWSNMSHLRDNYLNIPDSVHKIPTDITQSAHAVDKMPDWYEHCTVGFAETDSQIHRWLVPWCVIGTVNAVSLDKSSTS